MSQAERATDHRKIREWAERRGGTPARLKDSGPGGIPRIDFGEPEDRLEPIEWERFFEIFDENGLEFLCQEQTGYGKTSGFTTFVERGS